MNFAASPGMEDFISKSGPKMGEVASAAAKLNSFVKKAGVAEQGKTGAMGIEAGSIFAANDINEEASAAAAASAGRQSMINGVGQIASGFMGAIPTGGGGGGAALGEIGSSGSDMADFGYTPEQDIAFNSGEGIDYGWL